VEIRLSPPDELAVSMVKSEYVVCAVLFVAVTLMFVQMNVTAQNLGRMRFHLMEQSETTTRTQMDLEYVE
jgi:hypothetical protein